LKGIQYLELNHNQLTSISAATFNEMPNLLELYLHNNKLTSFDPLSLKACMRKIRTVTLANNQLTKIDSTTFNGLPGL